MRCDNGFRETIRRIQDGAIGKIHTLQANDYRGEIWVKPRQDDWTDMTWQMRNWYYFTWLSGDFNVEQHIHLLDTCAWAMQVIGSKGSALLAERKGGTRIKSETGSWSFSGPENLHYQQEHDELFASIRSGNPINNGEYMANSTLLAIMGRMAGYTGQEISWEMALNSTEDLSPSKYDWNLSLPVPLVATPGITTYS